MGKMFIDGTKLMHHPEVLAKWKFQEPFFPVHVEVSPTSACNHRCILCCVDYLKHKPQFLAQNVLVDLVESFAKSGVKSFLLAGEGEPLLNKHVVEMIQHAGKHGINSAVNTNGVPMTPAFSEKTLDKLSWCRISIQAADPKLYAYLHGTAADDLQKVKNNIAFAASFKRKHNLSIKIGIQQILLNENVDQIYEIAALSKELGVDYYTVKRHSFHPKNEYKVPRDLYKQALDSFEKTKELQDDNFLVLIRENDFSDTGYRTYTKCLGLPFITQVLADGGLYPCCQFFREEKFCFGNLYTEPFEKIWESSRRKSIVDYIESNIDVSKCMTHCRHHNVNKYVWQLYNSPEHDNFI